LFAAIARKPKLDEVRILIFNNEIHTAIIVIDVFSYLEISIFTD
jgi:hypothetical protein